MGIKEHKYTYNFFNPEIELEYMAEKMHSGGHFHHSFYQFYLYATDVFLKM